MNFLVKKGIAKLLYLLFVCYFDGFSSDHNIIPTCSGTPIINITPAGNNTFTIHIDENSYFAENATFSIAGNFQDETWNNSRVMTEVEKGKKYTWTGSYPKNFEFKVIQTVDGNWIWSKGDNIQFDGKTFEYTVYFNTPFDY